MNTSDVALLLFVFQSINDQTSAHREETDYADARECTVHNGAKSMFANGTKLDILYWNSHLGNENPIKIEYSNETHLLNYWTEGLPLKIITHGWLSSEENFTGVFHIKTAYVDVGGFNVISIDWSSIARDVIYPSPAHSTVSVGSVLADFLDRLVNITGMNPTDIHLIGHSLGAHVLGSCGFYFKSGKIGRITGLDPAAPGFEIIPINFMHLNSSNAVFVDVIHTTAGSLGFSKSIGHADFFPNSGRAPQPGCNSLIHLLDFLKCSHSKSYEYYAYSVYHKQSLVAVNCSSWSDFEHDKCENNTRVIMGHDTILSARGDFFLETNKTSRFGIF